MNESDQNEIATDQSRIDESVACGQHDQDEATLNAVSNIWFFSLVILSPLLNVCKH
jgi:hypothetical protein